MSALCAIFTIKVGSMQHKSMDVAMMAGRLSQLRAAANISSTTQEVRLEAGVAALMATTHPSALHSLTHSLTDSLAPRLTDAIAQPPDTPTDATQRTHRHSHARTHAPLRNIQSYANCRQPLAHRQLQNSHLPFGLHAEHSTARRALSCTGPTAAPLQSQPRHAEPHTQSNTRACTRACTRT
jgi:hypothetical protein